MTSDAPTKDGIAGAEWLRRIQEETARQESPKVIQLPLWHEPKRGTPNAFLRSALFAATHGNSRRQMKQEVVASLQDISVKYTGEQLIQSDLDVWEALVHEARTQPLGHICQFSAHSLLKDLGRSTGNSQHVWLKDVVVRLTACVVEITHQGKTYGGPLLQSFTKDEATGAYRIQLNPELIKLFGDNQWTGVDWQQRLAMTKQPLAQALHAFYSSHARPHPVKVETLHRITGSNVQEMRKFKQNLKAALAVLVSVGFLKSFAIESGMVRVERAPRYLPN